MVGLHQPNESQPPGVEQVPAADSSHAEGSPSGSDELPVPAESTPFDVSPLPAPTPSAVGPADGEPVQPIEGDLGSLRTGAIGGENGLSPRDGGNDPGLSFRFE